MRRLLVIAVLAGMAAVFIWLIYLGSRVFDQTPPVSSPPIAKTGNEAILPPTADSGQLRPADPEEIKQYQTEINEVLSPDRTQSAVLEKESDGLIYLKITDKKTGKAKKMGQLNLEDVELVWVRPDEIFIIERPTALAPASAWGFHLKNKTLRYLAKNEPGLLILWSPGGRSALKFSADRLSLIKDGGESIALPFVTLPNKCVFLNEDKFYCALPQNFPSRTVLPDDYLKYKFISEDEILAVSLNPVETKTIFSETAPLDAFNLKIIKGRLFFINRRDQRIYKLPL